MGEVDVKAIFDESFTMVTKQITGLALKKTGRMGTQKECYEGLIHTRGRFAADIRFIWNCSLYEYIASHMVKDDSLTDEEKILYVNEYMNITCGYVLSHINNRMGPPPSRLSVPEIFQEKTTGEDEAENEDKLEELCYSSEQGMMCVKIIWDSDKKGAVV